MSLLVVRRSRKNYEQSRKAAAAAEFEQSQTLAQQPGTAHACIMIVTQRLIRAARFCSLKLEGNARINYYFLCLCMYSPSIYV